MAIVKKSLIAVGIATTLMGSSFLAAVPANADNLRDQSPPTIKVAALSEAHPSVLESAVSLSELAPVKGGLQLKGAASTLTLPNSVDGLVTIKGQGKAELKIALPQAARDSLARANDALSLSYQNGNGSKTDTVPKEDGSVQIVTTIENNKAPSHFDYQISVDDFERIEILDDGTAIFLSKTGEFLGGAQKPWAVDASGDPVPTRYVVKGSTLTQIVDHSAAKSIEYPVYADPWLGVNLYSTVYSSGTWIANATPSAWGNGYMNNISIAWAHRDEIRTRSGLSSKWNDSMSEQTYCHVMGWPVSLPEFNIESWRPLVYWETSLTVYRCNPYDGIWS